MNNLSHVTQLSLKLIENVDQADKVKELNSLRGFIVAL
jgi:hypothetical protein